MPDRPTTTACDVERGELPFDPESKLPNPCLMRWLLRKTFASAQRGLPLALVVFTVEPRHEPHRHFGPGTRSELRMAVGEFVRRTTRYADYIGLWEDEVFLALLPDADHEEAAALSARLADALQGETLPSGRVCEVTFAATAYDPERDVTAEDLLERAASGLQSEG